MGISVDQSDTSMGVNEEPRSRSSPRFRVSMGISVELRCLVTVSMGLTTSRAWALAWTSGVSSDVSMGIAANWQVFIRHEHGHCRVTVTHYRT